MKHAFERPAVELGVAFPSDAGQSMLDVAARFLGIHRADVARGDDPLAQLRHFRALHRAPKLRLPDEKAL